jgi:hypothetical protein
VGDLGGGTSEAPVERFRPTSGRVTGVLALVLVAAVVVIGLVDRTHGFPLPVVAVALLVGVLVWAAMLRPRVWATEEDLVLRNMLDTAWIPLAAIEKVVVRQVLAVSAGEKRYVSPAVGKSWRQTLKSSRARGAGDSDESSTDVRTASYPDFVEGRISRLAEEARAKRGIGLLSDEQLALAAGVRRRWAWPEVIGLVVAGLLVVLSLFV